MVSKNRTIDSGLLEVFVNIVHQGGISAAALRMRSTKSAISKHLAKLEASLQVRLFERAGRRLLLTQEGKALLERAESILADLGQLLADVQDQKSQVRGTVRLAASPEFGALLSEYFVPQLLGMHPDLKLSMALGYALDDLQDPETDLAFRLGSAVDERMVVRHLGHLERVLIAGKAYLDEHPIRAIDDLAASEAILFMRDGVEPRWLLQSRQDPADRREVTVHGRYAVSGISAMARAAVGNLGIGLVPAFVAAPLLAAGSVTRVLPAWRPAALPVQLAYRAGVSRVRRVHTVIEAATSMLPQLLESPSLA